MNDTKPKTVFEERDELRRENDRLEKVLWTSNEALVMAHESLAESRKLAAQLTGDIEELTFCEDCTNDCVKMPENNCYPPRYCHTCQQILVAQICEANARLGATEEALAQVQRESAELRERYEGARKVADAAVEWYSRRLNVDTYPEALYALVDAVCEYGDFAKPPALSPSKQAAIDRGIAEAERVGEMWENN